KIAEYRRKNKDKIAEQKAEYYRKNKDKIAEYLAEYYRKNKRQRMSERYSKLLKGGLNSSQA
ncbi:MAG: hypothetical protein ABSG05_03355, partial [Candidatus Pacearchaeota archaeon]